jgi:rare lipoprotein A
MSTELSPGWQSAAKFVGLMVVLAPMIAACAHYPHHGRKAFTSREYGVPVSKRVTRNPNPPHGGGIAMVGKPYQVHGEWYVPKANPVGYNVTGVASYYGWDFHGRLTANGEIFSANAITGGSPDLPLPSYARVTNLENGRSMLVRFNDRGPYMAGRVADLSLRTAQILGFAGAGTARVRIQYVGPAPLNGDDTRYLMASLTDNGYRDEGATRLASVEPRQLRPQYRPATLNVVPHARPASREMTQVLAAVDALSYTDGPSAGGAAAATAAVASASPDFAVASLGFAADGSTPVAMDLGTYADPATARSIAMQFAVLGAVDETAATTDDGSAGTDLSLSYLKPGVTRQDVADLARELGLKDTVLY